MSAGYAAEREMLVCVQKVLFAGKHILLRTNAPRITSYVSDFLPLYDDAHGSTPPVAEVTLIVKDEDTTGESAPWFLARGEFAVARFTPSDTLWFNLRSRTVYGTFSTAIVADRERWRAHIFPTLLGILAAAIDIVPVHAACLAQGSRGVLLTAPSGTGKSTLAVALGRRGYAFLSDEWTCLAADDAGIAAWSFPLPVKLLPDASRFFPELLEHHAGVSLNGEIAYEVSPEKCFGLSRQRSCKVACVVLLERSTEPGCDISPIGVEEAIEHLVMELEPLEGKLTAYYEQQVELVHRLQDAACFRVRFNGHPDAVAEALDLTFSSVANI
jgi:hypothetical protein